MTMLNEHELRQISPRRRFRIPSRLAAASAVLVLAFALLAFAQYDSPSSNPSMSRLVVYSAPDAIVLASVAQDTEMPIADAGEDFAVYAGGPAVLNGTASSDNLGIGDYNWTFDDQGPRTLTGVLVTYVFALPGVYTVTLNVTDLHGNWDTDQVTVTVELDTTPPVANGGYNATLYVGFTLDFNASRSYDSQTGIVNYTWDFVYAGAQVVRYGQAFSWRFDIKGEYLVNMTVTNGAGLLSTASLAVTVMEKSTWIENNWHGVVIGLAIAGFAALYVYLRYRKNKAVFTPAEIEKMQLKIKATKKLWRTFRGNRLGFAGLVALLVIMGIAVFAPVLSTVENPNFVRNHESTRPGWDNPAPPTMDPSPFTGFVHPLGTDSIGRDVYSMLLYGSRASLLVGFAATLISIAVGVTIGLISGYYGKLTDEILMRFTDYFLVLPWFPLVIVIMTVLGPKFEFVILTIGITSWPSTARIVRSQVLSVKERAFIERSRAIGASDLFIIRKHVFPNVLPLVFANTVLLISTAIFTEAYLDFFGLGDPTVISWGIMLEAAYENDAFGSGAWWWTLPPSLAIIICVLSFSLVGYALDDIFNPRLRKR
jgi:peptide/nickel transport system permease protein